MPYLDKTKYNINNFLFFLVCTWFVFSSIYYVNFLLLGDVSADRDQSIFQSSIKIIFCFIVSAVFFYLSRMHLYLVSYILFFSFFIFLYLLNVYFPFSTGFKYFVDIFMIMTSLLGYFFILRVLSSKQRLIVVDVFVFTGCIVSFFSIFEIFFLPHLFLSYWSQTGGVRSVSTLLNPNNMGVYIGACIVLLFYSSYRSYLKIFLFFLFLYPFFMSGSRTAWLGLSIIFLCINFFSFFRRVTILKVLKWMLLLFVFCLILFLFLNGEYKLGGRFSDGYTASIRLNKYFDYISGFEASYFFPDFLSERERLVSENMYFMVLNYFGIFIFFFVLFLFFSFFKMKSDFLNSEKDVVWVYIFLYFLLVGFFESIITSFPNNQLLFLAAGSLFACDYGNKISRKKGGS